MLKGLRYLKCSGLILSAAEPFLLYIKLELDTVVVRCSRPEILLQAYWKSVMKGVSKWLVGRNPPVLLSAKLYTEILCSLYALISCSATIYCVYNLCLPQSKMGFFWWMFEGTVASVLGNTSGSRLVWEGVQVSVLPRVSCCVFPKAVVKRLGTCKLPVGFSALSGCIASFTVITGLAWDCY